MTSESLPPAADAPAAAISPAVSPHRGLPWRGFLIDAVLGAGLLVGISTLFIVPIVVMHVAQLTAAGKVVGSNPDLSGAMPAMTIAAIAAMLCTALVMWFLRGRTLVGPLSRMEAMPAYAFAAGAGIAIQILSQGFAWLLAQAGTGIEPSNAQPVIGLLLTAPVIAWLLIVLVGPFAEELLMRHVLLRRFALAGYPVAGLVLTSVAFALLHEPVPTAAGVAAWLGGLAMYAGMGAAFGGVYLRTGRFTAAFVAHAACNAAALLIAAYSGS